MEDLKSQEEIQNLLMNLSLLQRVIFFLFSVVMGEDNKPVKIIIVVTDNY